MPPVPEKSERLRNAERPEIYPFCSLPIEDVERGLKLQAMEEMMQAREPELVWDFLEMNFEERLEKDALVERISNLLLLEPDLIQKYFSRDDSLLLAVFFKTPRSRVVRKQWTSVYSVMPDFQNWIDHFTPDYVPPVPLYDVDDQRVGQIRERVKSLLPTDGAIMKNKQWTVGGVNYAHSLVWKANTYFGIAEDLAAGEVCPLFWALFENRTRLNVQYLNMAPAAQEEELLPVEGSKD